jgi:hypothetical protein
MALQMQNKSFIQDAANLIAPPTTTNKQVQVYITGITSIMIF